MAKVLVMPKLGLTMKEGRIVKWYKKEGDEIAEGDKLYSIETDKLTNDVEANDGGILRKIIVEEGGLVPCLEPVAIIANADEDISELLVGVKVEEEERKEEEIKESKVEKAPSTGKKIRISPVAKKLAIENNLDFENIIGTGPGGRIVLGDIEKAIENKERIKVSPAAEKLAGQINVDLSSIEKTNRIMKEDVLRKDRENYYNLLAEAEEKRIEMSTMRKIIAERMSYSQQIAPSVNFTISVNMEKLISLRKEIKEEINLTYTDLIIKIVSLLLIKHPLLNSSVDGEEIIIRNFVNMGVAVALEDGLIVPVIKNTHIKKLQEISHELKDLSYRAKTNQLNSDEISGGTFTITNLGTLGIESFTPIINQPESAILGVNAIVDKPIVENGKVCVKPIMKLSLTADHRNVDGAVAALFLSELKKSMENPLAVLI